MKRKPSITILVEISLLYLLQGDNKRIYPLSTEQKEYLELRHPCEGDKRIVDRIKAVLII